MANTQKKDTKIDSEEEREVRGGSRKNRGKKQESTSSLKTETRYSIYAVISFLVALFFVFASFQGAGVAGSVLYSFFKGLVGVGYIFLPIVSVLLGVSFIQSERPKMGLLHTISATLFLLSTLGLIDIASNASHSGGLLGRIFAFPFLKLFDTYLAILFQGAILLISLFILFDERPNLAEIWSRIVNAFKNFFGKKKAVEVPATEKEDALIAQAVAEATPEKDEEEKPSITEKVKAAVGIEKRDDEDFVLGSHKYVSTKYTPPPLSLLERDKGKPNVGDIKSNSNIIKRTLQNFGILVEMDEITIGPTVTRYALKPAEGVKLSRIVGLQNDLALSLAAHPIRIEAPIPGKSLVGVEIPNKSKATVSLGSLLEDEKFQNASKPLTVAIGRDIAGKAHFPNLAKMPHGLIAGTTGSGKSVTIHSIITSLLYRNGPEDLKFIMVDPKRVELTLYNKIPHLLVPVITDAKKCIQALKWAATEMSKRYDVLEKFSVRDIESYHNNVVKGHEDEVGDEMPRMPYIVIIIDELADIMQTYPRELEASIVRLAQMSRAVGIHLILSTQRPEVNVITGLIKANVPTRVALRVPTQVDSRTILDTAGAEKLLGAGDMLFSDGEGAPKRIQSAFVSEDEVKKIVKFLADAYKDEVPSTIEMTGGISADRSVFESTIEDEDAEDEKYEEARQMIIENGKASTSLLQRKMGLGYGRAAKIIDRLEARGIIGPANGSKPRDVYEKPGAGAESTSEME
ncbi:MAG: segregation ATPase FtsK/SpoIIIE, family [Patescibacteria group bacterium]|nr:segregation ATPase FtsK/SpoIIIE, family [Patescibacteria group bacterium]